MLNRVLADAVLVLHVGFVVFVIFGALLALRWRWAAVVHLPAVAWGVWIELVGGVCPLTPLENRLREAGGGTGYDESFIEHVLTPLLYAGWMTEAVRIGLGVALLMLNVVLYAWLWRRSARSPTSGS